MDANRMLYAACNITFIDATMAYSATNDSWSILSSTPSSPTMASMLWLPLIFQMGTDELEYQTNIGSSLSDFTNVMMAYLEQNITTLAIGWNSGLMTPTPALTLESLQPIALGVYPVAPVLILIILLYAYSLTALYIFFTSFTSNYRAIVIPPGLSETGKEREVSALDLTRNWLTDALPLVGTSFPLEGPHAVAKSVSPNVLDVAPDDDSPGRRLRLGIQHGGRFRLWRDFDSEERRNGAKNTV